MSHRPDLAVLLALVFVFAGPAAALADSLGAAGAAESLVVYSSASTEYANRHGKLIVREDSDVLREYSFGGARCQYKTLLNEQIEILAGAINNPALVVVPRYFNGVSNARCLVGVEVRKPATPRSG